MKQFLILGVIGLLFTSCAFNIKFHRVDKIPIPISEIPSFDLGADTTFIDFNTQTNEIKFENQHGECAHEEFTIKNIFFKSKSGNRLNAFLMTPKIIEPIASILHFHGSSNNLLSQYQSIAPLVKMGYQVFTFDYSGYGFSEGKATRKDVLVDAYTALEYVVNSNIFEKKKLIVYGHSYGGYLAAIVGSNSNLKIDGIVMEGAFSSHRDEAIHTTPFWGHLVGEGQTAVEEIKKNKSPLMVIHSSEDQRVPIAFGRKIYENANQPKLFYEVAKGHNQALQHYAEDISKELIRLMINE